MCDTLQKRIQGYTRAIEEALAACFTEKVPQRALFSAMLYSLLAGGKRIRPILTLEFCRVCGGDWQKALPAACGVEMIHTYSLIHDDLPCMDNDDFRRGKPTNHRVYGEATAVLAGDALLTAAFSAVAGLDLPPETVVRAVRTLALCAGERGMVGGQILDMEGETRPFSPEEIHRVQELKTGALISAACQLGVLCAGGDASQLDAAKRYASAVGLAFQTQDDILDVTGDFDKLGKQTGMDTKKNTFVALYGLETCRKMVAEQTQRAVEAVSGLPDPGILQELAELLAGRNR